MDAKRLTLIAVTLVWCAAALAVPADDTPRPFSQPDGSTVTLRLCGDEFYNFHTTIDGYTVLRNANGAWTYARQQGDALVSTGTLAHDPAGRTASELTQVAMLRPRLTSPSMVKLARERRATRDRELGIATTKEMARAPQRITGVSLDRSKFRGLVILINYNNKTFSTMNNPRSFYQSMIGDTGYSGFTYKSKTYTCQGSARDYFNYQSNGQFNPPFDVYGPVTVNYSQTYIQQDDFTRRNTLFAAALRALDSSINYSNYDSDNDGTVDMVYFIVPGYTSDYTGNNEDYLWPHAAWLRDTDGSSLVQLDGKYINRYACSGEIYGWESNNDPFPLGIGTLCHEFSHVLGLPDLYDTDYDTNGQSHYPGYWDIMASGGGRYDKGRTPVNYSTWERHYLGFATATTISSTGSYTMNAGKYQGYILNTPNSKEYFTLENRQKSGWDTYLPGHGLLVCRVDESNSQPWDDNDVNINPSRNYYVLLRAGGSTEYDAQSDSDPFPGTKGVTSISATTSPANLLTWDGKSCTRKITNITENGTVITFKLETETATPVSGDLRYELVNNATEPYLRVVGLTTTAAAKSNLSITIPPVDNFNGTTYPVREIGASAFSGRSNITSVTFKWGCRTIGNYAFQNCTGLTTVRLPSSLYTIGSTPFSGCSALKNVYYSGFDIPGSMSGNPFPSNSNMTLYVVPGTSFTVDQIKSSNFGSRFATVSVSKFAAEYHLSDGSYLTVGHYDATKYNTVHEMSVVGWVGDETLTGYTPSRNGYFNIGGINFKITEIADYAFQNETSLQSLNLANCYFKRIGEYAFYGCTALKSATVKSTTIEKYAFCNCTALTSLTLQEGVQTIVQQAFRNTGLTTITIPASATTVSAYFVDASMQLTTINVAEGNTAYASYSNMLFNKSLTTLLRKPIAAGGASYPSTMTAIGLYAFEQCSVVTSVVVPYGVTTIGTAAFNGCSALKRLLIPSSVTTINNKFILNCSALNELYLNNSAPPTVSNVEEYFGTTPVGSVNLHVPYSSQTAYRNATGWKSFKTINNNNEFAYDGALNVTNISNGRYSILTTSQYTYYDAAGNKKTADGTAMYLGAGKGVTTLTGNANLPTGFTYRDKFYVVTRIAPYTLSGTSGTPYTLGGGPNLTTIDEYAFYNCPTISSLTITGPLTKVGMDAFSVMTNCAEVTLETDNDISPSFTNRLYGGCKSGFKFFVNNKIYYSCLSNMDSWGSINSDSQMRSQLKPFLKAEANVQPFSCYMDYVDLSASGLTNAYWVTGYDSSKAMLKTTKATSGQSNIWSRGLILTNLTPGKIYKLQYGTSNYLMVTTYLTHNGKTPTTVNASSGYHVWNAGSKTFVKPTSSVTVPVGSAMLSLPTSAQSINTWTIDILGNPYDVNNDGKVDVGDVNTVLDAILAHSNNAKYDVNGDTKVDVGDVNTILAAILN